MQRYEVSFSGIGRLFGTDGLERLRRAHVCVIGIGGVGSWIVEALARSGIGELTLVDLDDVCVGNANRQIHAVAGEFGKPKVDAMQRRVASINPDCRVHARQAFFTAANAGELLAPRFDFVVDAFDSSMKKSVLIAHCRDKGLPVITVGAAGGRSDPTQIRVADLVYTANDRLLLNVRKTLRNEFGFPRGGKKFNVDAVYSTEAVIYPNKDGSVCHQREAGADLRLDCSSGFGTASFVTGAFGFAAAAHVVRRIASAATAPQEASRYCGSMAMKPLVVPMLDPTKQAAAPKVAN